MSWFAERADRIILLFDAHKLDISDEFKQAIQAIRKQEDKIRIVLTKVDKKSARAAEVLASVRTASPNARVVSTSSKEGIGRAALWRALRGVVLPEAS